MEGEGRCWWGRGTERKRWQHPVSSLQLLSIRLRELSAEEQVKVKLDTYELIVIRFTVVFELESQVKLNLSWLKIRKGDAFVTKNNLNEDSSISY